MKVKNESDVAQSCLTLRNPMDCGLPGSSVHGIFQARVLEWGAIAFSAGLCYFMVNISGYFHSSLRKMVALTALLSFFTLQDIIYLDLQIWI